MNKLYKIGLLFIAGIVGYSIGNYIPVELLKPNFTDENLNKGEYYRLLISIISALITFMAVLVALFKDDLREIWKRPIINFATPDEITIEDLSSNIESETVNDTPISNRYISRIEVINTGNLPAINAEIYLDKLEFTPKDSTIVQNIEASSSALKWNGTESNTIIIPPGGKKLIKIAEITPPEIISTPESEKLNKPPILSIGDISNTKDKSKGKWTAKFSLYAQNHKPTSFTIDIEWNGVWKTRLTEFKNHYQITKRA
jgi:hypothetical protein